MNWLWFLAGSIVGLAAGVTFTCCLAMNDRDNLDKYN